MGNTVMAHNHAMATAMPYQRTPWHAELHLGFSERDGRTILSHRDHRGPLAIQKMLYPEGDGVCHAIILHPPGGLAGGDKLEINITAAAKAHALLTTPGAGKWYKANGASASQRVVIDVADNALIEWLPQETIVYDAAEAEWRGEVQLAATARYAGWEIICLGRQACGEQFRQGQLRQSLKIYRDNRIIWGEHANLKGSDRLLNSAAGLRGQPVFATFVVAAGLLPPALLEQCRAVTADDDGLTCVTALPEIFVGRYLGRSTQSARHYFEKIWALLRPWYAGMAAQRPRIWNT